MKISSSAKKRLVTLYKSDPKAQGNVIRLKCQDKQKSKFQYIFCYDIRNKNDISIELDCEHSIIADRSLKQYINQIQVDWTDSGVYGPGFLISAITQKSLVCECGESI